MGKRIVNNEMRTWQSLAVARTPVDDYDDSHDDGDDDNDGDDEGGVT